MTELPKTFIASIRVDLRNVAIIAKFLAANDFEIYPKSRGTAASLAIKLLSDHLIRIDPEYDVAGTEEAVGVLRQLGYGESVIAGRRDYKPLLKQMSKENLYASGQSSYGQSSITDDMRKIAEAKAEKFAEVQELIKTKKYSINDKSGSIADVPGIEGIIEDGSESEAESEQLKVRTPEDETKDIKKLRTAMAIPDGAPLEVLEENKTLKTNRS